ncbi:hypothetical protein JTB14_013703, partial [Gonioctena quinquepunctata]
VFIFDTTKSDLTSPATLNHLVYLNNDHVNKLMSENTENRKINTVSSASARKNSDGFPLLEEC